MYPVEIMNKKYQISLKILATAVSPIHWHFGIFSTGSYASHLGALREDICLESFPRKLGKTHRAVPGTLNPCLYVSTNVYEPPRESTKNFYSWSM